jgi:hypothetical protein
MRLQDDVSIDSRLIEALKEDDAISAFFAEVSREFPEVRRPRSLTRWSTSNARQSHALPLESRRYVEQVPDWQRIAGDAYAPWVSCLKERLFWRDRS